jgi:hypothetical protein
MCRISLLELQLPPYNFYPGDQVSFRVAARNEYGLGQYSDPTNQGFTLPEPLPEMPAPIVSERTTYTITLEWEEVTDWHSDSRMGH